MTVADLLHGVTEAELSALVACRHGEPHRVLGVHRAGEGPGAVVRAYWPGARIAELVREGGEVVRMVPVAAGAGLFAAHVRGIPSPAEYRVRFVFEDGSEVVAHDAYAFAPTLGELDLHLLAEGTHRRIYDKLGAHPMRHEGVEGTAFAVWAPNAERVSVIGDFNNWDGRRHMMRRLGAGFWEIFIPGVSEGALYKYEIRTRAGELRIKTDPLAFWMEPPPGSAARVWDHRRYTWQDEGWLARRAMWDHRHQPMAIYEVHLGSWRRVPEEGNRYLTYREMAPRLIEHVRQYGFTHIELLPVTEHPLDRSWGYQVTGFYAPTSRFGAPDDFKYFVDLCHENGIGVILDWVPAHFPRDDYALRWFDGTCLYEHEDPRLGEHRDWGTLIFNYGRNEVRNFLIGSARFWLEQYHIDGLRVDAVASMLYLDYSRGPGEWVPNRYGGRENLEAIALLQELNRQVYADFPGVITIAEESTAWQGVTLPTDLGGLGFGYKWNMGWMHDTLHVFSKDPVYRKYHFHDLTFSMLYEYSENFIMPLSHDEVVHGKGSLLNKMPGDEWQKFANLRLLLGYMFTRPGKKLLFMGTELAPEEEWNEAESLPWHLMEDPRREEFSRYVRDLIHLYRTCSALWACDHEPHGFAWIDCQDSEQSVLSYVRYGPDGHVVVVLNLTPVPRYEYRIGVPSPQRYFERLNSDSAYYGGSNVGNAGQVVADAMAWHGFSQSVSLTLPPLGCLVLEPQVPAWGERRGS